MNAEFKESLDRKQKMNLSNFAASVSPMMKQEPEDRIVLDPREFPHLPDHHGDISDDGEAASDQEDDETRQDDHHEDHDGDKKPSVVKPPYSYIALISMANFVEILQPICQIAI